MTQKEKTTKSKASRGEEIEEDQVDLSHGLSEKDRALHAIIADAMPLFKFANIALLIILFIMLAVDVLFLATEVIEPKDRIINAAVVMTLIGATAAEISAIIIAAISRFS